MQQEEFEKLIVQGFEKLPEWVRKKIDNVAVLVEDEPSAEERKVQGLADNETLLGLYKGTPLSERGDMYGIGMALPDTITLYRVPIEEAAADDPNLDLRSPKYRERVRQVVAETVWHEFAHHFGMDEHEVRLRERERGID